MPTESITGIILQWGLSGAVLAACGWYIMKKDKDTSTILQKKSEIHKTEVTDMQQQHRQERIEWMRASQTQHQEALQVSREVAGALTANAQAFTELSTLIKDRK